MAARTALAKVIELEPLCVNVRTASALTGISTSHLYEAMGAGKVPCVELLGVKVIPYDWIKKQVDAAP